MRFNSSPADDSTGLLHRTDSFTIARRPLPHVELPCPILSFLPISRTKESRQEKINATRREEKCVRV